MAKLQRFRECLVMPNNAQNYVKLDKVPENLKEMVNSTKSRFRESKSSSAELIKAAKHLKEGVNDFETKTAIDQIIEDLLANGTIKEDQSLWKFPVSRFGNVNGNGRIYPRELWENVINNQRDVWQGSCGLCDHPKADDDPGEFKYSSVIWYDMMIDDANKLIWAICSFVGTYGRLAQEIIEKGGKVGFSSSGFGELSYDGQTIDPDTYQIERVADIVTNPSQQVFGSFSDPHSSMNVEYSKQGKVNESIKLNTQKSKILQEKTMKVDAVNLKENKEPVVVGKSEPAKAGISSLEKNIIMKYVENMASEAEKIKKPTERLVETNKILKMVEESGDEELQEKVEESLLKARNDLEEMVEHAVDLSETFGGLEGLKENVQDIATQGMLLNEQVKDYKELAEGLSERNKSLYRENSLLKTKLALKSKAMETKSLKENKTTVMNEEKMDSLKERVISLRKEVVSLREKNAALNKGNKKLEERNGVLKTSLKKASSTAERFEERADNRTEALSNLKKELNTANSMLATYKEQIARLQTTNKTLREKAEGIRNEFEAYKEDQKIENHLAPAYESYVTDQINLRENKGAEIEAYWNDLCNQYGDAAMKPFERQIRGAKTYREAFNNFMRNRDRIDESFNDYENARISERITSKKNRNALLEDAGYAQFDESKLSVDEINAIEYENMKKKGFI